MTRVTLVAEFSGKHKLFINSKCKRNISLCINIHIDVSSKYTLNERIIEETTLKATMKYKCSILENNLGQGISECPVVEIRNLTDVSHVC